MLNDLELHHGGEALHLEKITEPRMEEAAAVITRAFSIWSDSGWKPQPLALVASYLLPDGHAVVDQGGRILATVCVREANPRMEGDIIVVNRAHRQDRARLRDLQRFVDLTAGMRTVYLYGLAVDPGHGRAGLGAALLGAVERRARELGHAGLLLETGKDASWLVAWYQRLGFEVIGESDPSLASPRTVMMLKRW